MLHPCDVAEDIGIAFGYNNIPRGVVKTTTVGKPFPLNRFTDLLRHEMAASGFIECLTMGLLSKAENYTYFQKEINTNEVVEVSNPKTIEFEVVRTHLTPGLLKCITSNKSETVSSSKSNLLATL